MAEVVLKNLTKKYDDVTAVDSIDLNVVEGELLVLLGPSGCGKSTTLRMIAGLEEITSGTIRIGDRIVNNVPPKDRDIAMVFQNYALYPHMNVSKNMAFGLKMRKVRKDEIAERINTAAEILGIGDLLHRKPAQLSGGQKQRVALGRAIVRQPEVFLFDEPLSNLDARLRVDMRSELVKLHRRLETTTIYVTHDQTEAMTMGTRVVVMAGGRMQQVAPPQEIYDRPANRFVAEFIGSPAMNLVEGWLRVENQKLWMQFDGLMLEFPSSWMKEYVSYVGKKVMFGIRPEDISTTPLTGNDDKDGNRSFQVAATVIFAQTLGAEAILELQCGQQQFLARVHSRESCATGEKKTVYFNMQQSHLFDLETDTRI